MGDVGPIFWVCKGFVVIVGKGCKGFGEYRLRICALSKSCDGSDCEEGGVEVF